MSEPLPKLLIALLSVGAVMAGGMAFVLLPPQAGNAVSQPFLAATAPGPEIPHPEVPRMSVDEARRHSDALFVDVRSEAEYQTGHIQGAVLVPVEKVESSLAKLPKDQLLILYCT